MSVQHLRIDVRTRKWVSFAMVMFLFGNAFINFARAHLHVSGLKPEGSTAAIAIFWLLQIFVAIPAFFA